MKISVLWLLSGAYGIVSVDSYNPGIFIEKPIYMEKDPSLSSESEEVSGYEDVPHMRSTFSPQKVRYPGAPQKFNRSIVRGKLNANPSNFKDILTHEFKDVSKDLGNKLIGQMEHVKDAEYDRLRFKQVFLIKKHVVNDGKRKIVNINVKERMVPRENAQEDTKNDLGTYALLGCILFLLAGLVFTTTIKMYQNVIRKGYFKGKPCEISEI